MSVIDEIAKINKDIRKFEQKLRKPGTGSFVQAEIKAEIRKLKVKRDELCKKL